MLAPPDDPNAPSSRQTSRMRTATQRRGGERTSFWGGNHGRSRLDSDAANTIPPPNFDSKLTPPPEVVIHQPTDDPIPDDPTGPTNLITDSPDSSADVKEDSTIRQLYFNWTIPTDPLDPEHGPIELPEYTRNKIRTAKYTPLSFFPKNLWFQFKNIANVYFLFTIILGAIAIFGVTNPALNAVPLIVIVSLTAIKDAIEDWRRTVLDRELNNAPIHRLNGYENLNSAADKVGTWRKVKKGTSRFIEKTWSYWKSKGKTPASVDASRPERASIDTHHRLSMFGGNRLSTQSTRSRHKDIPMTAVSPTRENYRSSTDRQAQQPPVNEKNLTATQKGSIVDRKIRDLGTAKFKLDYWKHVQVGDFVRIYSDDEIPADIIILATSQDDGTCYIETKNLDGETNLKVRTALQCGHELRHARDCQQAKFVIDSQGPQPDLYSYNGAIRWEHSVHPDEPPTLESEPITINQLLLRGCMVRNTDWVIGVVAFTGPETKIMLNSGITPSKRARLTKDLNWNVIYNFIILFWMCFIAAMVNGFSWRHGGRSQHYFEYGSYGNSPDINGLITFWAGLILFQNLVPISLYITLEIIRTLQALFIYSDIKMYYKPLDYPCTPKSWNISDDLGQVEYIFSDKTGTLTQNVMEFKKCTVNGVPYGKAYTEAQAGMQSRAGMNVKEESRRANEEIEIDRETMIQDLKLLHENPYFRPEDLTFVSSDYVAHLRGVSGTDQQDATMEFMLSLALCHTVVTEKTSGDNPTINFKAQSPDEAALVLTARDCGFTVLDRHGDSLTVNILGIDRKFTILNILEFNSSRKRMSVIVRFPDDNNKIVLFCKGADSMIYSRLQPGIQQELREATGQHLEMFAREGLRTLCISKRELTEEEYRGWQVKHEEAAASITDREEKLEVVADQIECNLVLLGGTAIEDRLQDGVPESIDLLGRAGIKLWVLTGDKVETAINIGFSCNLLDNSMKIFSIRGDDDCTAASVEAEIDEYLKTFGLTGSEAELEAAKLNHEPPSPTHAVVIDGSALAFALGGIVRRKFLILCQQCRSVLCCRVSPAQKADVVRMVKDGFDCLTLSIGDGANDVAMIQEAHVGIGIAGVEGRAAVMSSDYAIGQFRFLTRLVLVHGRWSYRRLAETISNFFYKNVIWAFTLFWYNIYATFDCPNVFDYTYIILFNLAFTSLPVIFLGVLDQDVSDKVSLVVPQLYRRGIERKEWTPFKFWGYMIDGLYQSVIVFFFSFLVFHLATPATSNGLDIADTKRIGIYVAGAAVIISNLYVIMNMYRWDWLTLLITAISILLFFFWTGVYTSFTSSQLFYKAAAQVFSEASFWAMIFVTLIACLLPRFVVKYVQKTYFPLDSDIIREQVHDGVFDYLKDNEDYFPPPPSSDSFRVSTHAMESARHSASSPAPDPLGDDDTRPIYSYPPSMAPTDATRNHGSNPGSDGTNYTTASSRPLARPRHNASIDQARLSVDGMRGLMGVMHPSHDMPELTSARRLSQIEGRLSTQLSRE